jgi:hypothetical protein
VTNQRRFKPLFIYKIKILIKFFSIGYLKKTKQYFRRVLFMRQIMGIQIGNRENEALKVQELLTKNGCIIKTRLGLHESSESVCSITGLIILEFLPDKEAEIAALEQELAKLDSVVVKKMVF